jgi:hypothetical protein
VAKFLKTILNTSKVKLVLETISAFWAEVQDPSFFLARCRRASRENGLSRSRALCSQVECVCCLLVLDSVTSTPQWIRQPKPRDDVHDVCVFVCKCVLGSSRASQPLNILAYAFSSTLAFSLRLMPLRRAVARSWKNRVRLHTIWCGERSYSNFSVSPVTKGTNHTNG